MTGWGNPRGISPITSLYGLKQTKFARNGTYLVARTPACCTTILKNRIIERLADILVRIRHERAPDRVPLMGGEAHKLPSSSRS